jgi:hypothetical protein
MTTWHLAAVGGILLLLSGCRTDPEITRLERENFYKQREIEHLRWQVEDLQDTLGPRGGPCEGANWRAAAPTPRTLSQPGPRLGPAGDGTPSTVVPRTLSAPGTVTPSEKTPRLNVSPGQPLPAGQVPETLIPSSDRGGSIRPADNSRVAQITLNQSAMGAGGDDRRGGSQAMTLLIEPRDLAGNLLVVPGDVSVALLDPGAAGGAAPLARWDFRAAQTAGMLQPGPSGGIRLDLPWPVLPTAPDHADQRQPSLRDGARVRLLVRYTTRDGRKLQTEQPIDLTMTDRNDSWRPGGGDSPASSEAEAPRTAARPSEGPLQRPVWSPERRF